MKLSERTVQILKNYASINQSLQFNEGNVLRTISPTKTVLVKATLEDEIPSTFAIYDLNRFLGTISMFNKPVFDIGEKKVNIKEDGRNVSYSFADPSILHLPPERDIELDSVDVSFELKQEQLDEVLRAMGIMGLPNLVIAGEDGKIILRATDVKNAGSDKYDIDVGTTEKTFNAVYVAENINKLIAADYDVSITSAGVSSFKTTDVEYWIAIEQSSSFE